VYLKIYQAFVCWRKLFQVSRNDPLAEKQAFAQHHALYLRLSQRFCAWFKHFQLHFEELATINLISC